MFRKLTEFFFFQVKQLPCKEVFFSIETSSFFLGNLEMHSNCMNRIKEKILSCITRPNCAVARLTVLCLYVPGLQRQVFKRVPKCKCIPLRNFPLIPSPNSFNLISVGILDFYRIPQLAKVGSCSGFRKCKRTLQI